MLNSISYFNEDNDDNININIVKDGLTPNKGERRQTNIEDRILYFKAQIK